MKSIFCVRNTLPVTLALLMMPFASEAKTKPKPAPNPVTSSKAVSEGLLKSAVTGGTTRSSGNSTQQPTSVSRGAGPAIGSKTSANTLARSTFVPAQPNKSGPRIADDGTLLIRWVDDTAYVQVPAGVYQVTLQVNGGKGWMPYESQPLFGDAGWVVFQMPATIAKGNVRALAFTTNKFGYEKPNAVAPPATFVLPDFPKEEVVPDVPVTTPTDRPMVGSPMGQPLQNTPSLNVNLSGPPTGNAVPATIARVAGSTSLTSVAPVIPVLSVNTGIEVKSGVTPTVLSNPSANVLPVSKTLGASEPAVVLNESIGLIKLGGGDLVLRSAGTVASFDISGVSTYTGTTSIATGAVVNTSAATVNVTGTISNSAGPTSTPAASLAAPTAQESDIWKFAGDRLFYFNQFRGLQVFDLHDPVHPQKIGLLRMPAVGNQIQLLDGAGKYLALFVRNAQVNWQTDIQIVAVDEEGTPSLVATLPLNGFAGESRLIGNRLYLVVSGGLYSYNGSTFRLQGYDLSDPLHPIDLGSAQGTGSIPVLQDAGNHLLAATTTWNYSNGKYSETTILHAFDISAGAPKLTKAVTLKGALRDQFKMSVVGGSLLAVSQIAQRYESVASSTTNNSNGTTTYSTTYTIYPAQTWVESFSLSDSSSAPQTALHLMDAEGETLYAVRFDGSRLYIVTYGVVMKEPVTSSYSWTWTNVRQPCDPLFIVDLADPAKPVVRGQLAIPGWSTFMEPLGDRLLSVGREGSRIAASLFDVSDADNPSLLSRVYPGPESYGWSTSEAETDHRAVTYQRDQNRFFVPVTASATVSATQEVNYTRNKLSLGSLVNVTGEAKRGSSINGYLVSISGRELVVATDPPNGKSVEVASLELSWAVDYVIPVGNYLLEVETTGTPENYGWGWWVYQPSNNRSSKRTILRLTSNNNPEMVLDSVELPDNNASVVGTSVHNGKVYLAQWLTDSSNTADLRTWMLQLSGGKIHQVADSRMTLPTAAIMNHVSLALSEIQPLWVGDNELVWFLPCRTRFWWYGYGTNAVAPAGLMVPELPCAVLSPVVFDRSEVMPLIVDSGKKAYCLSSVSAPIAKNGFLYFSSTQREQDSENDPEVSALAINSRGGMLVPQASGIFVQSDYATMLHVIDFRAGYAALEMQHTHLPGPLINASSVDDQGAWLVSFERKDGTDPKLVSLAYDGVRARRKDSQQVGWCDFSQIAARGNVVFLANNWGGVQPVRQNQSTGKLTPLATWDTGTYVQTLAMRGRYLMSANWDTVTIARVNDDSTLTTVAKRNTDGFSSQYYSNRAVLDTQRAGFWVPTGDYGAEFLVFPKTEAALAKSEPVLP